MTTVANFTTDHRRERAFLNRPEMVEYLKRREIKLQNDLETQLRGIDATDGDSTIDFKVRWDCFCEEKDLLYELKHVRSNGTSSLGWGPTSDADDIAYLCAVCKSTRRVALRDLRKAFDAIPEQWQRGTTPNKSDNGTEYTTHWAKIPEWAVKVTKGHFRDLS